MANDDKETLVDRWLRRAKNQPVLAFLFVSSIAIGAVASLTDSVSKVADHFGNGIAKPQATALNPDQRQTPANESPGTNEVQVKLTTIWLNAKGEEVIRKEYEGTEPPPNKLSAQELKEKAAWQQFKEDEPLWRKFKSKKE